MNRILRVLMTAALCVSAMRVAAAPRVDETLGKGVTLKTATAIKDLYEHPDQFVGKTVRVDGVATAVCQEMGCWITLAAPGKPDQIVRFKIEHEGMVAFPATSKGKTVSAEGVFSKIAAGDADANEAARESGAKPADFGAKYQVMFSGAVIK